MKREVVTMHRFQKVDGALTPSLLTFNRQVLPEKVHCACYRLQMKAYVPNPHHYFHCQSFGLLSLLAGASTVVFLLCASLAVELAMVGD